MPMISIIVPVYKVESYIRRCIDSILNQTFVDFELILVDDGSPDDSGAICDEYAKKDARIRVIHNQNKGVSAARNTGLDAALGEYISFIDSDDYVEACYLEKLAGKKSDLSICGSYIISEKEEVHIYFPIEDKVSSSNLEQITDLFDRDLLKYVWGKLFKRSIIEAKNLRFDTRISLGEDTVFALKYALLCKSFVLISDPLYYYIKYPSGTLTKQLTPHMVISNSLRDQALDEILSKNGIKSKIFYTANFVSKQKMKHAFFSVLENSDMTIPEKCKWYRLFFKLPLYANNIDILTDNCSAKLRWIIAKKSAILLILFQTAVKIKTTLKI